MLEHPGHFPCGRRDAGNRHDGMPVDLEDLVRSIVNHGVSRGGAAIARDEDAALKFEGENRRRLGLRDISWRLCRTDRTYGTDVTQASQQSNEIIGTPSAAGRIHHWPVRWR